MTAVRTSVIVCAYSTKRFPLLVSALQSLRWQSVPPAEIIVVIDHNPELLGQVRALFPELQVIENAGPVGLSGARNTGTVAATGEVVAYLDDDAVAEPGWLQALTAHYGRAEVLGVDGHPVPVWESGRPPWWPEEFDWVVGCGYRGLPTGAAPVRNLMGCAMSLRRDVVAAAGGFDTDLGRTATGAAGCEETELCLRATALFPDGVFLHEPAARARHHVPAARATLRYFRSRCRAEGRSKRQVAQRAGAGPGLASEATYVRRTLPAGVVRHASALARGDVAGPLRAAAILVGLTTTTLGFLDPRGARPTAAGGDLPPTEPVLPLVIDVAEPPRPLPRTDDLAEYSSASCLVLDDGAPVGTRQVELTGTETSTTDLLPRIDLSELGVSTGGVQASGTRGAPASVAGDECADRVRRDVTVAIATRGRPERLAECLASIADGTVLPGVVVVVDNAPPDTRTEELIARYRAEGRAVRYVREDRPGLSWAHNAAVDDVRTELVAFTDDDVVVHPRWLEALTDVFDTDPDAVCVTGMIAPRELDTLPQQWVESQGVYGKGFRPRVFDNGRNRPEDPMFPLTAGVLGSGANMAFRTDYLRESGGFDVALGTGTVAMGGDDLAAFYDVIHRGRRLVYEPGAIVLHPHHRDLDALRRQVYGYGAGLGAHLTRCVLEDPRALATLLRHHRAATARLGTILRPQIDGLPPYPRELSRAQRRGLVSGPARYLVSRHRARRVGPPPTPGTRPSAPARARQQVHS